MVFLVLVCLLLVPLLAPWPAAAPSATSAGTALWSGRTGEVILQGLIILSGVFSILLLLGSGMFREGSP
jgi:hypothetical protein